MKKFWLIVSIVTLFASLALAQETSAAKKLDAGLRLGVMNNRGGLVARYALSEKTRIEAAITTPGFNGTIYTGLFEMTFPLGEVKNLSWYFGGGLHMGYWAAAPARWNPVTSTFVSTKFAIGIDAIAGIQYNMESLVSFPLTLTLDYKPGWDFTSTWADQWADVALSVRYAF